MQVGDVHWNMNKEKERFCPNFWSSVGLGLDHLFQAFSVLFYLLLGKMDIFRERQSLPVSRVAYSVISDQARATSE